MQVKHIIFHTLVVLGGLVQALPRSSSIIVSQNLLPSDSKITKRTITLPDTSPNFDSGSDDEFKIPHTRIILSFSEFSQRPLDFNTAATLMGTATRHMYFLCEQKGREDQPIKSPASRQVDNIIFSIEQFKSKRTVISNKMLFDILLGLQDFFFHPQGTVFWGVKFDVELDGNLVGKGILWDVGIPNSAGKGQLSSGNSPSSDSSGSSGGGSPSSLGSTLGSSGGSSDSIGTTED